MRSVAHLLDRATQLFIETVDHVTEILEALPQVIAEDQHVRAKTKDNTPEGHPGPGTSNTPGAKSGNGAASHRPYDRYDPAPGQPGGMDILPGLPRRRKAGILMWSTAAPSLPGIYVVVTVDNGQFRDTALLVLDTGARYSETFEINPQHPIGPNPEQWYFGPLDFDPGRRAG